MTQKVRTLFVLLIVILLSQYSYSQLNNFECGYVSPPAGANNSIGNPFSGLFKPTRTDISSNQNAAFPVLVVFVQFYGESSSPRGIWPTGQAPIFLDSLIALEKNTNTSTPFWEKYNQFTERISSRWAEISRGAFHVISPQGAFSVVLPKTAQQYWLDANRDMDVCGQNINRDIWSSLITQNLTDWRAYDRWKKVGNDFVYCDLGDGDGFVDMIYKVHKSPGTFIYNDTLRSALWNMAGYNSLGNTVTEADTVDHEHNICVYYQGGDRGSGVTLSFSGTADNYIATMGHEHLHLMTYTGGHVTYSNCSYGIGIEYFYSPYDMILNNYMTPTTATFGQTNTLSDFSSRNTGTGEILKVPISDKECFLLANRNKVSKWDRVMLGDTASYEQYKDNTEYGKGLYIYHVDTSGIRFPGSDLSPQDMECADGYWQWEYKELGSPKLVYDCYVAPQTWRVYNKSNVLYSNDPSLLTNSNSSGDEISFRHSYGNKIWPCWWGVGKQPIDACHIGTDRIQVNDEDIYTKSGNLGDRWDAWKPGYNEVFSTYSSPSSLKWYNDTSGIFIWYDSLNGTTANIKIYRASEYGGNMSLASILAATPPSRPMGLKVDKTDCIQYYKYPVLTWNHNMEPDMLQSPRNILKRYKIYRASEDINNVPTDYTEIADITVEKDQTPTYIDYSTYSQCEMGSANDYYMLRYKIKAVDNTNWASVYSDFVSISTYELSKGGDSPQFINPNIPKEFNLSQNYPNPFNPMTKINFALPKQGFVTLKIYDITGREIKTLVNEFKQAGYYKVDFNGSLLSSGVYFCRIQSGDFISVKRMVLIK